MLGFAEQIEFIENLQVAGIVQAVSGIGVNRQPDPRKFLSHGGHKLVIFAGLNFQFNPLIAAL